VVVILLGVVVEEGRDAEEIWVGSGFGRKAELSFGLCMKTPGARRPERGKAGAGFVGRCRRRRRRKGQRTVTGVGDGRGWRGCWLQVTPEEE
jgi:hypothetical protein